MWENILERDRPQMTIWRTRIACWRPKSTDTHSENVMLIAFPLQQWSHERASMLRYTYIVCRDLFLRPIPHSVCLQMLSASVQTHAPARANQ
jgi:hypothetical protein